MGDDDAYGWFQCCDVLWSACGLVCTSSTRMKRSLHSRWATEWCQWLRSLGSGTPDQCSARILMTVWPSWQHQISADSLHQASKGRCRDETGCARAQEDCVRDTHTFASSGWLRMLGVNAESTLGNIACISTEIPEVKLGIQALFALVLGC